MSFVLISISPATKRVLKIWQMPSKYFFNIVNECMVVKMAKEATHSVTSPAGRVSNQESKSLIVVYRLWY